MSATESLSEHEITCHVAEELRLAEKYHLCISTHNPMGEKRDVRTGARLKRMGTKAGWPDFEIICKTGSYFLELKKINGRLSLNQKSVFAMLEHFSRPVRVAYGLREAMTFLDEIGCLYRPQTELLLIHGKTKSDSPEDKTGSSGETSTVRDMRNKIRLLSKD